MDMQITIKVLVKLWDTMCNSQTFRPAVSITDFEYYWLLLKSKWELADKNHSDTWMYSYEVEPCWFLIKNKWTL